MLTTFEEAVASSPCDILFACLPASISPHQVFIAWADELDNAHDHIAAHEFYILIEPLSLHIFRQAHPSSGTRCLSSLVHWLLDRRMALPIDAERPVFDQHVTELLTFPGLRQVVNHLLSTLKPGKLASLSIGSGTVELATLLDHPAATSQTTFGQHGLPESGHLVGSGTRRSDPAINDDLVSSVVGVVRQERLNWFGPLLPTATTRVISDHGRFEMICGGKSSKPIQSLTTARCEAVERFHLLHPPLPDLHLAPVSDLPGPVVPPDSLFYSHQPDSLGRPGACFQPQQALYWIRAFNPSENTTAFVPAQSVYFTSDLPGEQPVIESTTNACALGGSYEEACLFALFEAIERDAYFIMWYLRRPCLRLDPASVEDLSFRLLFRTLQRDYPQYRIYFFDITADIPAPSIAAFAVRVEGTGPKVVQAVCCKLHLELAMHGCLSDLAAELGQSTAAPRYELEDQTLVHTPEDHRDLYALDASFHRLAFLGFDDVPLLDVRHHRDTFPTPPSHSGQYSQVEVLTWLAGQCKQVAEAIYLRNLSLPTFSDRGIYAAKAITPHLFPVWFGDRNRRISITPRLRSLAMRYVGRDMQHIADLNLDLHPFS